MTVRIGSHNVLDGFSDPNCIPRLLDTVANQNPDVMFYSEAYNSTQKDYLSDVTADFGRLGYTVETVDYQDDDGRTDTHGALLAVKRRMITADQLPQPLRLASRNALRAAIYDWENDEPIHGFFSHFDDRSSLRREKMVDALASHLPPAHEEKPTVLAGDLNSADRRDGGMAKKLRAVSHLRPLLRPLYRDPESVSPDTSTPWKKLIRANSLAYRASDMAADHVLDHLAELGLTETDKVHEPTKSGLRLDHILQANMYTFEAGTLPANDLSDHRAIWAELDH